MSGVGIGVVGGRARTTAGMAGVAGCGRSQGQMLHVGTGSAREGGASGALRQPADAGVAGQAGACPRGQNGGIGELVADVAERGRRHGSGSTIGVAVGAVRREGGRRGVQVAIALGGRHPCQEGDGMGRPTGHPGIDGGHVDVGVAGQGATTIALGGAGHRVGAGPGHDRRIEHDGAAGHLIRRCAGGHGVHGRGVQVLEVRQGPG